jgi:hypothetical protein
MNLGQFTPAAVGMNLTSLLGSFRMSYTDGFNGNVDGPAGVGKGSAQATFNGSTLGGALNFSAATMMGSSGIHGASSSGAPGSTSFSNPGSFGTAPMGAGMVKRPTRMSF